MTADDLAERPCEFVRTDSKNIRSPKGLSYFNPTGESLLIHHVKSKKNHNTAAYSMKTNTGDPENRTRLFFKILGVILLFILIGFLFMAGVWVILHLTVIPLIHDDFLELLCLSSGLLAPIFPGLILWRITRKITGPWKIRIRGAGASGLGLSVLFGASVIVPLLLLGFAYRGVHM